MSVADLIHRLGGLVAWGMLVVLMLGIWRGIQHPAGRTVGVAALTATFGLDRRIAFFGTPEDAWRQAANLSAQVHVRYIERPYKQVLSVMPTMYDEIWTGAKGMYKMEPVVADGGELIIYAPHITEVSYTHGRIIDEMIGRRPPSIGHPKPFPAMQEASPGRAWRSRVHAARCSSTGHRP